MARPVKNNVDYFPFYVKKGRTMSVLNRKHGNDGYATHIKILAELANTDYHYLDVSQPDNLFYLAFECGVSEDLFIGIVTDIAKLNKFDLFMWENFRVIWCEDLIKSLSNVYDKRGNDCMDLNSLRLHYESLRDGNTVNVIEKKVYDTSSVESTQSKVKKSKVNIIKQVNNVQEQEGSTEPKDKPKRVIKKPVTEVKEDLKTPDWLEVWAYISEKYPAARMVYFKAKYEAWIANGWEDFKGNKIKNWKSKFSQQTAYEGALGTTPSISNNNTGRKPRITL